MRVIGLRELRQNASELLRQVEAGDEVVVTVSGRPSARIVPAASRTWRRFDDISELFGGDVDPEWFADRELVDQSVRDPWGVE